jgi:predicted DNA-binding protein (MmcQ/YjbR family)
MNVEELRAYCLNKKGVTESTPFDDVTLVFKVMNKMFALIPLDNDLLSISLKCDPEKAIQLREQYPQVTPAWHFNKNHWNSVLVDGTVEVDNIKEWVDHSYNLVVSGLTKKLKEDLKGLWRNAE